MEPREAGTCAARGGQGGRGKGCRHARVNHYLALTRHEVEPRVRVGGVREDNPGLVPRRWWEA